MNWTDNTLDASIRDASVTASAAGDTTLLAKDTSDIFSLAGGIAGGRRIAFGAGVAYNSLLNHTIASVSNSTLNVRGNLSIASESTDTIQTIALGGAGAQNLSLAGAFAVNVIGGGGVESAIQDGLLALTGGTIDVSATDSSTVDADAGGVAIAIAAGGNGPGASGSIGASVALNNVGQQSVGKRHKTNAFIDGATLTGANGVTIDAHSTAKIETLTIAGALAVGASQSGGLAFSGAGAGSGNAIYSDIHAGILNGSSVSTINHGAVSLSATDDSTIKADAGAGAIAGAGGSSGGVALAGAGAAATNEIGNSVESSIRNSPAAASQHVIAAGSIMLATTDNATITSKAIAGVVDVAVSGEVSANLAVGAALASNDIHNTVRSSIENSKVQSKAGDVLLPVSSTATIDAVSVAASIGASISPVGVNLTASGATASNEVRSTLESSIERSSDVAAGRTVSATVSDTADIDADIDSVAVSIGVVGIGFAGALTNNTIDNSTSAFIADSTVRADNSGNAAAAVKVDANADPDITANTIVAAASLSIGVAGALASANSTITGTVQCYIDGSIISAPGDTISVAAASSPTAAAAARGGSAGLISIAAMLTDVSIGGTTQAYLDGTSTFNIGWIDVHANDTNNALPSTLVVPNHACLPRRPSPSHRTFTAWR